MNWWFPTVSGAVWQGLPHKEIPLAKEIVKFAFESLVFQNKLLNGAHSIWDVELSCSDTLEIEITKHDKRVYKLRKKDYKVQQKEVTKFNGFWIQKCNKIDYNGWKDYMWWV